VVVAAAGNYGRTNPTSTYGYGTITAPGNDPYVITVGAMNDMGTATRTDDVITTYSSRGPTAFDLVAKPDIVAPGNLIDSTLAPPSQFPQLYPTTDIPMYLYQVNGNQDSSRQYLQLSGTSMATPFVSAAAALLIQQNPSLTPDQVKARLMLTATKAFPTVSSYTDPTTGITYKAQYDIFTVGAGYLNVDAALSSNAVPPATQSAISPSVAINVSNGVATATLVNGSNALWDSNVVWGTHIVWGTNVVWGANVVWGSNVVWGASNLFLNALNTVTGSNVPVASNVVWGAHIVWGADAVQSANFDTAMAIVTGGDR
jgi:serine protease AprX